MKTLPQLILKIAAVGMVCTGVLHGCGTLKVKQAGHYQAQWDAKTQKFSLRGACNQFMAQATVDTMNRLILESDLIGTTAGCEPDLMQKDIQLKQFLASQPSVVLKNNAYYLVNDTQKITGLAPISIDITNDIQRFNAVTYTTQHKFVYVSSKQTRCPKDPLRKCLLIRMNEKEDWQPYDGTIEGFIPEEGISYRLRVNERLPAKQWVLDLIVEQTIDPLPERKLKNKDDEPAIIKPKSKPPDLMDFLQVIGEKYL